MLVSRGAALAALVFIALPASALELSSPDVAQGVALSRAQLYRDCGGADVSPALAWRDAPWATRSFAVTLFDPDAEGGWWHWIVYDIPADVHAFGRGAGGTRSGRNDFGRSGYGGACPPVGSGVHHYRFTVWALPVAAVPPEIAATGRTFGPWLDSHAIGRASLTAVYRR
jgi:Raf kinase inhibitor-like YbhB/YbcL family protein